MNDRKFVRFRIVGDHKCTSNTTIYNDQSSCYCDNLMNSFSNVESFIRGDLWFGCTRILLDKLYYVRRNISVDRSS